ncbi:hypothetical protein AHF37_04610 [Paragonimus kellicotti]|nr:hypothetical protein AHF37_04610 [Paragonimus kellicotti]
MVRHFQQMGARVTCTTTREHMIYTVDVAPNFATRAGYLLARMATGTSYYEWELKSTAYKLMRKDIDLLNRRNLPALAMELLHQAAFGESSAGTGLGHSVFAPADRVGSHSFEQIESFHKHFFVPANCTISLVGHDPQADGLELLREIKAGLQVRAPQKVPEKTGKVHGFVGGDIRRDLAAAPNVTACIAWPTPGTGSQQLPYDVASCLLSGSVGRISYGGCSSLTHLGGQSGDDEYTQPIAFHKTYDGHGLVGCQCMRTDSQSGWRSFGSDSDFPKDCEDHRRRVVSSQVSPLFRHQMDSFERSTDIVVKQRTKVLFMKHIKYVSAATFQRV